MSVSPPHTPHILIVAGEASGDMHGANLVKALLELEPTARVSAMGAAALAASGANLIYNSSRLAVVGIIEVLGHLGEILAARRLLLDFLRDQRPDLLILIDYPDFNLLLAAAAKKLGIPVFYYISPQVWAWRRGRVRTIKRLVNRMAVILPFEKEFYRQQGLTVDFVGHPLVDELNSRLPPDSQGVVADGVNGEHGVKGVSGVGRGQPKFPAGNRGEGAEQAEGGDDKTESDPLRPVIGLLPGSRRREIAALLPVFLAAARKIAAARQPAPVFLLPLAPGLDREILVQHGLEQYPELDIRISRGDRHRLMASCAAVMAASGTVTLELAILGVPMVSAYRVSPLTYLIGRWLVRTPFTTLVNLVAGRVVIKELIQDRVDPELIATEIWQLLDNPRRRRQMLADLAEIRQKLGGPGASRRAAAIALAMVAR